MVARHVYVTPGYQDRAIPLVHYHHIIRYTVCTKGSRFPYILLLTQEVGCLLCCHDDITPCACALHGTSAQRMRIKYFIFATTKYSVLTLLLRDKCNICVWGGTAKGHRAEKRSSR